MPVDRGQTGYLLDRLLTASPQEVLVIREALQTPGREGEPLALDGSGRRQETTRRAPAGGLCAGRLREPDDARWRVVGRDVAARLVAENGLVIAGWAEALRPVRQHLLPPLAACLVENNLDAARRRTITHLYGDYAKGLPDPFVPPGK